MHTNKHDALPISRLFVCGISIWSALEVSTPRFSTSPIGLPHLLVKTNFYGWLLPRALTGVITVSSIRITSHLRLTIFFPVLSAISLKPPCRFPLGPSEISPFVLGFWLLQGASSSCTWQYCPIWRLKCFCNLGPHQTWWFLGSKYQKFHPSLEIN